MWKDIVKYIHQINIRVVHDGIKGTFFVPPTLDRDYCGVK